MWHSLPQNPSLGEGSEMSGLTSKSSMYLCSCRHKPLLHLDPCLPNSSSLAHSGNWCPIAQLLQQLSLRSHSCVLFEMLSLFGSFATGVLLHHLHSFGAMLPAWKEEKPQPLAVWDNCNRMKTEVEVTISFQGYLETILVMFMSTWKRSCQHRRASLNLQNKIT